MAIGLVLGGVALATAGAAATVGAELCLKNAIEEAMEKKRNKDSDEEDEDEE